MKVIASSDELILAKEMGMRFPEKYKKGNCTIDVNNCRNIYDADIYYFLKRDDALDISYLAYWNGHTFKGGYICYRNHYTMAGHGLESVDNGVTIYADDTKEIRNYLKRFKQYSHNDDNNFKPDPSWIMFNFILYDNQLHFWGVEFITSLYLNFSIPIEIITGIEIDELEAKYLADEKFRKPQIKYIAVLPLIGDGVQDLIIESGDTVSAAWKKIYKTELEKNHHIFLGIDEYHRTCHYEFKKSIDNYKEPMSHK